MTRKKKVLMIYGLHLLLTKIVIKQIKHIINQINIL